MHVARLALTARSTALAALLAAGCGSPSGVGTPEQSPSISVTLASEFQLRPGQSAQLDGPSVRLTFVKVLEDSRCPIDAVCVWAGNAQIQLRARSRQAEADLDLNTLGDGPTRPRFADFEGYRIHLVALVNPNRASAQHAPEPSEYVATLRVEALPPSS